MARLPHPPPTPALTRAIREWSGWFVVAAGAVLCVLGWYGISGENMIEQQFPYLASATIPGAALIVAGASLIASRPAHRTEHADKHIETLYTLLVADAETPGSTAPAPHPHRRTRELLAVPGGTLYHRRDCPLIAGKPTAEVIDETAVFERSLTPCPVCEPPTLLPKVRDLPAPPLTSLLLLPPVPDPDSGPAPAPTPPPPTRPAAARRRPAGADPPPPPPRQPLMPLLAEPPPSASPSTSPSRGSPSAVRPR